MPDDLQLQIIETMKASENAVKQAAKLIELLAQVDTADALNVGESWRKHGESHQALEDTLTNAALWPIKM